MRLTSPGQGVPNICPSALLPRLVRVAFEHRDILTNATSLVGSSAVTSILGFVYWAVAARSFPAEAVGFASASVSAMALLAKAGQLGFGTLLMGELPRRPGERHSLISASLAAAFTIAAALGLVFAAAAPRVSESLAALAGGPVSMLLFALGVGLTGSLMVLDSAMVGLLRGELQLWRNSVFAVSKLLLLLGVSFWLGRQAGMTIVATWVLGLALSLVAFLRPSAVRSIASGDIRPRIATMTRLSGLAVRHHLLNMAIAAPHLALPLLVTVLLSASANAYFYSAWMMASVMFIGLFSLTSTLYASGRGTPTALWRKVRLTLALALGAGLAGNLLFLVAGQQLLGFFGASYAEQATPVLRVVALGVFTLGIREHYITIRRIEDDLGSTAVVTAVGGLLELALAALGASLGGLLGLGIGWVAATCLEALYMAPTVIRAALPRAPLEARTAVV